MIENLLLASLIVFFSLVQSVFGVGLLLFGTPSLLLLGYNYSDALFIVLPASLVISLFQISTNRKLLKSQREIYFLTLPAVFIGLILILKFQNILDIKKIVGSFLLIIGCLRISKSLNKSLEKFISDMPKFFYIITGIIHGFSNMGGGPLTIHMSTIHKDKISIRTNIAYVYFWFCLIQLAVLIFMSLDNFKYFYFFFPLLSCSTYFLANEFLMKKINEVHFQQIISFIIIFYGIICFV